MITRTPTAQIVTIFLSVCEYMYNDTDVHAYLVQVLLLQS
jgi:hypothetical protein